MWLATGPPTRPRGDAVRAVCYAWAMSSPTREESARSLRVLRDLAHDLLSSGSAELTEAELAAKVLGARPTAAWSAVLAEVLGSDARFERTDGAWRLAGDPRPRPADDGDFVAISLATTGPDVRRHRLVRISAVRVNTAGVDARFDAVINPGRRLPRYLSEATGVSQEFADESPPFAAVADELRAFLGSGPIVAYGAQWAMAFLCSELTRADLPVVRNPTLELDDLVRELLTLAGKPTLASVAQQLGFSHPRPGYPPADAEITGRIAASLIASRRERGSSLPSLSAGLRPPVTPFERHWLAAISEGPGVYVMEDMAGTALYVGKAVNLRRRVSGYASRSFALNRRLEGLAVRAARVRTLPTPSDLEARLLEVRLIREHRPPFNVSKTVRPRAVLLRAGAHDPNPRLALVRGVVPDGALYVGPFRSERAARQALTLARSIYPRACTRRGQDPDAQRQAVLAAVRLLAGQKGDALSTLQAAMRASSRRRDHLSAERTRRLIRGVLDFEPHPSPLLGLNADETLLVVQPNAVGARRAHLIRGGRLLASTDLEPDIDLAEPAVALGVAARLAAQAQPIQAEEDLQIVLRWLGELTPDSTVIAVDRLRRKTSVRDESPPRRR
jgi:DNA polymerase III subunit epsilon